MSLLVFCLVPLLTEFWNTAAGPSPSPIPDSSSDIAVPLNNESPSEGEDVLPSSTTTAKSSAGNAESSNYLTRLDFISVIVICAIVAFCFGICVVIGCRRKKRHSLNHDVTDSLPQSFADSRNEPRATNLAYSPSDLRVPESPPPTYSIIERQTSFSSYVSQTSSQYEVPPDYNEALSFGDPADGESSAGRASRPGSVNGSERSSGRFFPAKAGAVAVRSKRSESARTRGPPRARYNRSSSDAGRARRSRLTPRPATVSEDDTSQCSVAVSAATAASSGHAAAAAQEDAALRTISVTAEVIPASSTGVSCSGHDSDVELARPLLPLTDPSNSEFAEDDAESGLCDPMKDSSMTRKLTLV